MSDHMRDSANNRRLQREIYAAQLAFLGVKGQERLRRARVHVAGLGGAGFAVVGNLVAAGVGTISANDPQVFTIENLNRLPFAGLEHVNIPKTVLLTQLWKERGQHLITSQTKSETPEFKQLCRAADLLVCCSNTVESRIAAAREAARNAIPLVDVSVADARTALAGFVKIWLPENAEWTACPACYFRNGAKVPRNENILGTVAAGTAALGANIIVQLLAGPRSETVRHNLWVLHYSSYTIEALTVTKRNSCVVCSSVRGGR